MTQEQDLEILEITDYSTLTDRDHQALVETYQATFRDEPYQEEWSVADVDETLQRLLGRGGNLLVGRVDGIAMSFAGGYPKTDRYYIDELAVAGAFQRRGLGRVLLRKLMAIAGPRSGNRFEIRTSSANDRALRLYQSEGFVPERRLELVPHMRTDGSIRLDRRVTLSSPPATESVQNSRLRRVVVAYPSGNTTALVFDDCADRDRRELDKALKRAWETLRPDSQEVEQCGFVTEPENPMAIGRLEMMGGEFCGNALRSAVWIVCGGHDSKGIIEASGTSRPLFYEISAGVVTVEIPLPQPYAPPAPVSEGILVRLDGITHLVIDAAEGEDPHKLLSRLLASNAYGLANEPAAGVTAYNADTSEASFAVWVREHDSIYDETACGSGTSAIALAKATARSDSGSFDVQQPSGDIIKAYVIFDDGKPQSLSISGSVAVLYDGEVTCQ